MKGAARHGRFPHPGPLPEGEGERERAARDFHRKLYGISESTARQLLEEANLVVGEQVIIRAVSGLSYPLKIVVSFGEEIIAIITNCPLKKGEKR